MALVYLSRRNLEMLLSRLDMKRKGADVSPHITKNDTSHPAFPCSERTEVIAIEDEDYYVDREAGL